MKTIWGPRNEGDTVGLYACQICGASVQAEDRDKHEKWHKRLDSRCVRAPGKEK